MTAISLATVSGNASGTGVSSGVTGSIAWGASTVLNFALVSWIANTSNDRTVTSVVGSGSLVFADCGAGRQAKTIDGTSSVYHQVFYALGNNASEAVTVTMNGTVDFLRTHFCRASGDMDLGNAGANAIVQHVGNTGASATPSITLSSFGDATNNAVLASWGADIAGGSGGDAPKSGFTQIHDFAQASRALVYSEWRLGEDTAPNYTSSPGSVPFAGVAIEIKSSAAGTPPPAGKLSLIGERSALVGHGRVIG